MRGTKSCLTMLVAPIAVTLLMALGGCAAAYYDDGRPHWDGNVFYQEINERVCGRDAFHDYGEGPPRWDGNVFHHEAHERDYGRDASRGYDGRWNASERNARESTWTGPRTEGHESSGGGGHVSWEESGHAPSGGGHK
ncbi:MAG: hypothetical protein ABSH08_11020 [Tepidisphaeraceae bacterium]